MATPNTVNITLSALRALFSCHHANGIEVVSHEWEGDDIVNYGMDDLFEGAPNENGSIIVTLPTNQIISVNVWEGEVMESDKYSDDLVIFTESGEMKRIHSLIKTDSAGRLID